jgi:hypothetical protein
MVMVGTDPVEVDRRLVAGEVGCPGCGGRLRPWGHARWRTTRGVDRDVRHRPRRASCSGCSRTHVLLPASWLVRRADAVAVIGAALVARAMGGGHRRIAAGVVARPESTVRGWLRRFAARTQEVRELFTGLLHALDPLAGPLEAAGTRFADAVEVIGRAAAAAVTRLGPRPVWEFASAAAGGRLLSPPTVVMPGRW